MPKPDALAIAVTENGQITQLTQAAEFKITLSPAAVETKRLALLAAEFIEEVTDIESQTKATNAAAILKGFSRDLEKSRKYISDPFLEVQRAIMASAREAATDVDAAATRLENLVADYQRKERAKAEAIRMEQERIAREIETARLRAELLKAQEEERKRQEEEDARRRAEEAQKEAARQLEAAKGKKAREEAAKAQAEADKQAAEAKKLADERAAREMAAEFAEPAPAPAVPEPVAPPKATGATVQYKWEYEVTSLEDLFRAYGTRFVRLELDKAALNDFLKWPSTKPEQIPGIKAKRVLDVNVRAAKTANLQIG